MSSIPGHYFDGKTSARLEAVLSFEAPESLHVSAAGQEHLYPFRDIEISPRLGNTRRVFRLPDGGVCETDEIDVVDAWLAALGRDGWLRLVHKL